MNTRIKELRVSKKMSQEEFGKQIGITKASVSRLESGENNPSDQTVLLICNEYGVNEEWLRTGNGEMYKKLTRNQEIAEFANEVMENVDESFKKRFVIALSKLNESDWETLEKLINELK